MIEYFYLFKIVKKSYIINIKKIFIISNNYFIDEKEETKVENKSCEMLVEYLQSIFNDERLTTEDIRIDELDEQFQQLGQNLQALCQYVQEMKLYSAHLSRGNLSVQSPSYNNVLCKDLKLLHANLDHLTRQAKMVASGDYSQYNYGLGEISDVFNMMVEQLKIREKMLVEETEKVKQRALAIESYNKVLIEMTRKKNELILVVDKASKQVIYCNEKGDEAHMFEQSSCIECHQYLSFYDKLITWKNENYSVWEEQDHHQHYYRIISFPVEWHERHSYLHVISDITVEKIKNDQLANKAYHDTTGIYNRLYFEEYIDQLLKQKREFLFCLLDIDGLKYVNDHFSHPDGDAYIQRFIVCIQSSFRSGDVLARIGGDEFALIIQNCKIEVIQNKLKRILENFVRTNDQMYPTSFSYGIVEVDRNSHMDIDTIMKKADYLMYQRKKENKLKYHQR